LAAIEAEPIESDSSENLVSPKQNSSNQNNHAGDNLSSRGGSESRDSFDHHSARSLSNVQSPNNNSNSGISSIGGVEKPLISLSLNANAKKKKLEVKDVFNNDDESEESNGPKKRKLVPLGEKYNFIYKGLLTNSLYLTVDYDENTASKEQTPTPGATTTKSSKSKETAKSSEEKRKHIKSIIDKIPTEKLDLFNYPLDRGEIDSTIEKKIRPWINKKIIEYIGEPEPTLVDFICSKVLAGSPPQVILDDVQMVLDEEAEVFVVKMWRLLIYEVEAKKVGISK
jgi:RNA-binding protein 25